MGQGRRVVVCSQGVRGDGQADRAIPGSGVVAGNGAYDLNVAGPAGCGGFGGRGTAGDDRNRGNVADVGRSDCLSWSRRGREGGDGDGGGPAEGIRSFVGGYDAAERPRSNAAGLYSSQSEAGGCSDAEHSAHNRGGGVCRVGRSGCRGCEGRGQGGSADESDGNTSDITHDLP